MIIKPIKSGHRPSSFTELFPSSHVIGLDKWFNKSIFGMDDKWQTIENYSLFPKKKVFKKHLQFLSILSFFLRTVHKYGLRFIEIFDFLSVLFLQNVKFPSLFCCYHFCFVLCSYQSERHGRTGAVEERSAAAAAAVVRTTQPSKSFLPSSTHVLKTHKHKNTQKNTAAVRGGRLFLLFSLWTIIQAILARHAAPSLLCFHFC